MTDKRRLLLIQGHPDPQGGHLCHALAGAYEDGALAAGREIRRVNVATLEFPLLRRASEWNDAPVPPSLLPAQEAIAWAQHLVLFFPLWLGDMPALLKGFLEQVARPGFAFHREAANPLAAKALGGRSARVVVTMGMPALLYRTWFRAHGVQALERNVLGFAGIAPVNKTLIGSVEQLGTDGAARWLARLRRLGSEGC